MAWQSPDYGTLFHFFVPIVTRHGEVSGVRMPVAMSAGTALSATALRLAPSRKLPGPLLCQLLFGAGAETGGDLGSSGHYQLGELGEALVGQSNARRRDAEGGEKLLF